KYRVDKFDKGREKPETLGEDDVAPPFGGKGGNFLPLMAEGKIGRTFGGDPGARVAKHAHFRAAEAVDRLFGVADDEQIPFAEIVEKSEHDFVLQPVGILELVDHDIAVPAGDPSAQIPTRKKLPHLRLQVLEIERPLLGLFPAIDAVGGRVN